MLARSVLAVQEGLSIVVVCRCAAPLDDIMTP